ncbi:MAG TPA: tRNA (adenosine(37)-N6)-threonylcarbamoyltransferase complex ATPase subunit type 1 TsaE [Gemmataceae bacterium]|nr:tRNA (adenosine(37)-N6)-threonylcarbamoyltransferase complex ATPase subunit type 1 TsaE [Gemmataceae bacterium]
MHSARALSDLDTTIAFGRALGQQLQAGDVIALIGPLGAGKTHLVRAIAEGLGVPDSRAVSSPTFTLIHEYKGRLPIFHFDVYRLKSPAEFLDLGATEYFEAGGVCLIEWADRVLEYLPKRRITIELEITGETSRSLTIDEPSEPRTK